MKRIIILILCFLICTASYGQGKISEEALKAAFIFHFFNFVEWSDHQENFYVCIPDDEALREVAAQELADKIVNQRKVVVVEHSDGCHVLISNDPGQTETTLTIGSLNKGAMLEFRIIDHKLKFAISPQHIKESKLKISSQLLKLAIVDHEV